MIGGPSAASGDWSITAAIGGLAVIGGPSGDWSITAAIATMEVA